MARAKKKDATQAPEATQEAHLDPAQLGDMDDANLQQLARDMGLDPAAYPDREALIAAIAEVPVIPGPPEPEGSEQTHPYQATITAALAVLRRTPGPADKPVTTLTKGTKVTITESRDGYGKLDNGLWVRESLLDRT